MERKTTSVTFFARKGRVNKKGEAAVVLRITIDGVRVDHSIKRSVLAKHWDSAKGRAVAKSKECKELNYYIDTINSRLLGLLTDMERDEEEISSQTLLNKYLGVGVKAKHTILNVFREHNDKCANSVGVSMAKATVQRYVTSYNHTAAFIKHKYGVDDLELDKVNHKFVTDYKSYLRIDKGCNNNSTVKYLKNFKKITSIALAEELITKDPFSKIKFKYEEVNCSFLTAEELENVATHNFTIERLRHVRDVFVFCCLTALSFSDVKSLRQEHIVKDNYGRYWIRKQRQKTKVMCNIPIIDAAQALLDKYKEDKACKNGQLLPVLSNQKYNSYIKEIMDQCDITKVVTSHTARHTAATTTFLANDVSLENVSKMLGHTNTKMTAHYAKVLDKSIMADMQMVNSKMRLGLS